MKAYKILIPMVLALSAFFSEANAQNRNKRVKQKRAKVVVVEPHRAYASRPARGVTITNAPAGAVIVRHSGVDFRYHNGVYYRPQNGRYTICNPVIGLQVRTLPPAHRRVLVNDRPYFYDYGVFYVQSDQGYRVVSPPVGAYVEALPQGYQKVSLEGQTYYELDGTYYRPMIGEDGSVVYEVVGTQQS